MNHIAHGGLRIAEVLYSFVMDEALPGSGVEPETFWAGADALIHDFAPRNRELVARRDELQRALDDYHRRSPGRVADHDAYLSFLTSIGYLTDEPAPFEITTADVDPEVSVLAGPQLVVPLLNARFATNAANARWGSLYDALYGTDVIGEDEGRERRSSYNPVRGAAVIARAREFLDAHLPLDAGSHASATGYCVDEKGLAIDVEGERRRLAEPSAFVGYRGKAASPEAVLLVHHGLHVEIQLDSSDPIGAGDPAGIKDVILEAAVSTIMDLEDSVAAVDAADKVLGYRHWLLLMQGG